jgi:cleavage and polyadenylation specificity factor subunit 3
MTRPTKEIYNLVLRDSIKVKSENLDQDIMNEKSIEESLKNIEVIDYNQEIDYRGIKLKCYNAGHVLGAAMFMVEIDGVRVLYTGDYSTENERFYLFIYYVYIYIYIYIVYKYKYIYNI